MNTAFDRQYTYTLRGQVETVDDHVDSSYNQSFLYDGLGQLTTATGKWGSASFTYDAIGNIKSKVFSDWPTGGSGSGNRAVNMSYDGLNRLQSYTDTGPLGNKALSYDNRGNFTALGGLNMAYDYSDQPTSMSGTATADYKYDGNLKRVKSIVNGKTIYNVYDKSGALTFVDKRTDAKEVTTVRGAGMTIARIIDDGLTEDITYIHGDHLGSVSTGTDSAGAVKWREHYSPYGEALDPQSANDNLAAFTGHIRDADTGLTYMQARYYDPVAGRFLSIDPVTFASNGRSGMFNRYSYTLNDPVNMIDPDGECSVVAGAYSMTCPARAGTEGNTDEFYRGVKLGTVSMAAGTALVFVPGPEDVAIGTFAASKIGQGLANFGSKLTGAFKKLLGGKKERMVDIYEVPPDATPTGKPYVGSGLEDGNRLSFTGDGRDRTQAVIKQKVPESQRRPAEQQQMNDSGGFDALDNRRNEIAECKWRDCGVTGPD